MKKIYIIAVVAFAILGALAVATHDAQANCKRNPNKPGCQVPQPPPPPPPVLPPPPGPPPVCADGLPPTPGEGAYDPNDNCARPPTPPPLEIGTPPPPPVVLPPPPPLKCDAGMSEISRSATQIVCAKVVVKTRIKTKIKRVKQRPKIVLRLYCPAPRHPEKLTG